MFALAPVGRTSGHPANQTLPFNDRSGPKMLSLQVTCHVPDVRGEAQQIKSLGGAGWQYPVEDVIWDIEHHVYTYWITAAGRRADLTVAQRPDGQKYLKTQADGAEAKSLLALPQYLDPSCRVKRSSARRSEQTAGPSARAVA